MPTAIAICLSLIAVFDAGGAAARGDGPNQQQPIRAAAVPSSAPAAWTDQPRDDLADLLEPIRAKHGIPALAAAATRGDRLLALGVAGVRVHGSKDRVQPDDRFHLGSCTKSMTALLCAMLVEQGKLRWDMTIGEALGERAAGRAAGVRADSDARADVGVHADLDVAAGSNPRPALNVHPDFRKVTLEQLLNHRSGLTVDRIPNLIELSKIWGLDGPLPRQRLDFLSLVLARRPAAAPGAEFAYANAGFVAAGAMAEAAAGEPYEQLIQRMLFAPLGITTAGFGPPGLDGSPQPQGHRKMIWYTGQKPSPGADNPPVYSPAGRAHMSIGDFARYAAFMLRAARGSGELIRPATFARMRSDPYKQNYSFGWGMPDLEWAGGRVLAHDGSNTMWYAIIVVAPARDLAIVVATNVGDAAGEEACRGVVRGLRERFLKAN